MNPPTQKTERSSRFPLDMDLNSQKWSRQTCGVRYRIVTSYKRIGLIPNSKWSIHLGLSLCRMVAYLQTSIPVMDYPYLGLLSLLM